VFRPVALFTIAGVVAVLILGVATEIGSRKVGEREAVVDARTKTSVLAQGRVEPVVTNGLVVGNLTSLRKIDRVIDRYVLDNSLVRVKIWKRDGTIVYSDETRLIGTRSTLAAADLRAIDSGRVADRVTDLAQPENRLDRSQGRLLEVYLPIRTPDGQRLLFKAYFRYSAVTAAGDRLWRRFAPITFGALLALALVQIPLAWALARRLRRRGTERDDLLPSVIATPDEERPQIAGDLFGTGFVDHGLADLLARAHGRGIDITLTENLHAPVPPTVAELLYRAAREAVRNVLTHTNTTSVMVRVSDHDQLATLEIIDDSAGLEPGRTAEAGHVGLRALTDLIADTGGRLVVDAANGTGTRVHVEVPLP
jgi:two-component system, NarL family, sensor kinase